MLYDARTFPCQLLNLNGHAPGHALGPDAEIDASTAHLDGVGVIPALGQQNHRLLRAGAQEDGSLPLFDGKGASDLYRIPGLPSAA